MNIKINYLKNIKEFDLSIEDKKINFIFGISGSGKTTIAEALTKEDLEKIVQIGKQPDDILVTINGKERNINSFKEYNLAEVEKLYLYKEEGEEAYEIIFANSESYFKKIIDYQKLVSELSSYKDDLLSEINKINELMETQKIKKLSKRGELYASTVVKKVQKLHEDEKTRDVLEVAKSHGQEKVTWLKKGTKFLEYQEKICPFCEQDIKEDKYKTIENLSSLDNIFFHGVNEAETKYADLGIKKPNYLDKKSLEKHEQTMIKYMTILKDLININDYIELSNISEINPQQISKLKISNELTEIYPQIANAVNETNKKITQIKRQLSRIKSEMKKIIAKNKDYINRQLELLGTKYSIVEKPIKPNEKKASFILKHNDDNNNIDRSETLSTGEKNLIALIFFLIKNQKKNLIIDDPASSFDESRRKIIYNMILKASNDRMVLVLSHDEVFTKFAIRSKYRDKNDKIGVIKYISNYTGNPKFQKIKLKDYGTLENFAKERINSTSNPLLHAINSRLIFETCKDESPDYKAVYCYLSGIIHCESNKEIITNIKQYGVSEENILKIIKNKTGAQLLKLSQYDRTKITYKDFTNFEKIFVVRETEDKGNIREEMSNLIHLNDTLAICINPYKYDTFSPYIYERINKWQQEYINAI